MNKEKFLKELAFLLQDISREEREDAVAYYQDYFAEAGIENEEQILQELQSPERVAALIKAGLNSSFEETIEYSESSMGNSKYNRQHEVVVQKEKKYTESNRRRTRRERGDKVLQGDPNRNKLLLGIIIAIFVVFASPVFGVGFAFIATALILLCSLGIVFGALGVTSIAVAVVCILKGLFVMFTYPGAGLISIGTGLIFATLGIVLFANVKWPFNVIPNIFTGAVNLIKSVVDKVGEKL